MRKLYGNRLTLCNITSCIRLVTKRQKSSIKTRRKLHKITPNLHKASKYQNLNRHRLLQNSIHTGCPKYIRCIVFGLTFATFWFCVGLVWFCFVFTSVSFLWFLCCCLLVFWYFLVLYTGVETGYSTVIYTYGYTPGSDICQTISKFW